MTDSEKRFVNSEKAAVEKRLSEVERKLHTQTEAFKNIQKGLLTFTDEMKKDGTPTGDFFKLANAELPKGIQA